MNEPNSQNFSDDTQTGGEESSLPIGVGESSGGPDLERLYTDQPKRKVTSGVLLIIIVVAIAATGLFSMRTVTKATAFTGGNQEIERNIESFIKMIRGESAEGGGLTVAGDDAVGNEAVLRVLTESYVERQVPVEGVQRNPFIIFDEDPVATPDPGTSPSDLRAQRRRQRQAIFEQAAGRLRLRSVLLGSQPLANVNNKIVRVGESITVLPEEVDFEVAAISADTVTLLAEDPSLDLVLEIVLNLRPNNP